MIFSQLMMLYNYPQVWLINIIWELFQNRKQKSDINNQNGGQLKFDYQFTSESRYTTTM